MAGEPATPGHEPGERVSSLALATLPRAAGWARRFPDQVVIEDADPESGSGRGLLLVQALTKNWGFEHTTSGGKVVVAVLGMPANGRTP